MMRGECEREVLLIGTDETLGREDTADSIVDLSAELVIICPVAKAQFWVILGAFGSASFAVDKWRKMTGRELDDLSVELLLEVEWDIEFTIDNEESGLLPVELIDFVRKKLLIDLALGEDKILSKSLSFLNSLMCSNRLESWSKTDDFENKFFRISEDSFSAELFNCTVEVVFALVWLFFLMLYLL